MIELDFEAMDAERKLLLLGLSLTAMTEMRLLELEDRDAAFMQLGPCVLPGCTLVRSTSIMPASNYGGAVALFLIWRRLAERIHDGARCPHLRLTAQGRAFLLRTMGVVEAQLKNRG